MTAKSSNTKKPAEQVVKDIRRATRREDFLELKHAETDGVLEDHRQHEQITAVSAFLPEVVGFGESQSIQ
ncbi:hypothetical protein [Devosia psychrophila]|uniref:hypothetical protein n=1 Tax=Devosia psychrophila TaxID=728005 RepID=UPI000617F017|nr:hypothetical protein [Devosia psychrophila]